MNDANNKNAKSTELAKVLYHYKLFPEANVAKSKICCPLHDGDANPSMLIDFTSGTWFCFGCQRFGDAESLCRQIEKKYHGANDLQACKKFYEILRSSECESIRIDVSKIQKQSKQLNELYAEAYDYYHGLRQPDWEDEEENEDVQEALEYMRTRGFSPQTLNKVRAKVTYNWSYGLIFPMLDNGKFRGWVSRTMRKNVEEKRKYLYNEGFSRATTLVGQYGGSDHIILTEGYMDRLRFVECGLEQDVAAVLGWKLSQQQEAKIQAKGIRYIISALDNDDCGRKGTDFLKTIFGPSRVIRWQYLKGVKDPGEMSPEQFLKMYNKTMCVLNERRAERSK